MEPVEILGVLSSLTPDAYFQSSMSGQLPRYAFFHKALCGFKREIASTSASSEEEYGAKVRKRRKKMKRLKELLRDRGRRLARMTALDLGAGFGIEALLWRGMGGGSVIALDRQPCALDPNCRDQMRQWMAAVHASIEEPFDPAQDVRAVFRQKGVEWLVADAASVPVDDESLDLVFSISSLEHIGDIERAISEVHRLLKPGGIFYAEWSNFYSLVGAHSPGIVDIPWGHVLLTPDELRTLSCELNSVSEDEFDALVGGLNRWHLRRWRETFDDSLWKVHEWKHLADEGVEPLIPLWLIDRLPRELTIVDLVTDDIRALLEKR
ncbi:MAG: class I SAM-dependent methyltransferase [bacterium]